MKFSQLFNVIVLYFGTGSPRLSNDELQEQLNNANLKVSEYRNQVQSLKQEMKIALKVTCLKSRYPRYFTTVSQSHRLKT